MYRLAVQNGGTGRSVGVGTHVRASGDCAKPVKIYRYSPGLAQYTVEIDARCRKCPRCDAARRGEWARRALEEFADCERAWLVTLTFGPTARESLRGLATDDQGDGLLIRAQWSGHRVK